mgnify:CR=1 FL=1
MNYYVLFKVTRNLPLPEWRIQIQTARISFTKYSISVCTVYLQYFDHVLAKNATQKWDSCFDCLDYIPIPTNTDQCYLVLMTCRIPLRHTRIMSLLDLKMLKHLSFSLALQQNQNSDISIISHTAICTLPVHTMSHIHLIPLNEIHVCASWGSLFLWGGLLYSCYVVG